MATVAWKDVLDYIEEAFAIKGEIERSEVVNMALARGASDDVVDALDTLGSRVFKTPEAVKEFLLAQKAIVS